MEKAKICKHNMKLYPVYRTLSYDFLFFYTINFLFLTQVKHITASLILVLDAFYSLFCIFAQIPASIILDKIGRKKTIMLGTIFSAIYLTVVIYSKNFIHLILAEILCASGFALKDIGSPSMLNESIPITKRKSEIFAKLSSKAVSGYYILNAISLVISGFLYSINPFAPIVLSLIMVILAFLLSTYFLDPEELSESNNEENKSDLTLKESFKFIFSSGRLKSLILFSSLMTSIIYILASSEVYLVEDLKISSGLIGIIFAILGLLSGVAAKKQQKFHDTFRNKSLTILGLSISIACITSTLGFFLNLPQVFTLFIIIISLVIKYSTVGIYYVLIGKYISNFTNEQIDSRIYSTQILCNSICSTILEIFASIVLNHFTSYLSVLIFGITFLMLFIITSIYMKKRLGLSSTQYSKEEIKYSKS